MSKKQYSTLEIGIIGNPNSGKTTLFNALTGQKQEVGNWPGVTVEQKVGHFTCHDQSILLMDLPGTYTLIAASEDQSLDERIACDYVLSHRAKAIINVVDASNLERNLYLTLQLLEMGVPVIVALNMMDVARRKSIIIDIAQLSTYLGCPVIPVEATKKRTLGALKDAIFRIEESAVPMPPFAYPAPIERAVDEIIRKSAFSLPRSEARRWVLRLLEGDCLARASANSATLLLVEASKLHLSESLNFEPDILMAEARYSYITDLIQQVIQQKHSQRGQVSQWIDKIVLNRFLGLPIFFVAMFAMFFFAINVAGLLQDVFDHMSDRVFVQVPAHVLINLRAPSWVITLISDGLGKGLNTVVTFIPVICGMFLSLSFLEQSGYMARAAFVIDRLMRWMGLPGKSFVPMIVGFGCNVPAVMAARTLENKRERVLTIMMTPFMSCGARLTIFAVFVATFFPEKGALVVFALYLIGIFVAVLTGWALRKTLLKGESAPFVLELPTYHWPTFHSLYLHTWHRLRGFVIKAGALIIPVCILLSVFNVITVHQVSLLAWCGQALTPLFAPMGIVTANWPATVGLFTGLLAKEVVIATLNSLYAQTESLGALGQMYQYFGGSVQAFAYLLFVLLYFPCVSTTAAISREIGYRWAWFSVFWTTFIAYGVAVFYYQAMTWCQHPLASSTWMTGLFLGYVLVFFLLKRYAPKSSILIKPVVNQHKLPCCAKRLV